MAATLTSTVRRRAILLALSVLSLVTLAAVPPQLPLVAAAETEFLDTPEMSLINSDGSARGVQNLRLSVQPDLVDVSFLDFAQNTGSLVVDEQWLNENVEDPVLQGGEFYISEGKYIVPLEAVPSERSLKFVAFDPITGASGFGMGSTENVQLTERPMTISVLEKSPEKVRINFEDRTNAGQSVRFNTTWLNGYFGGTNLLISHQTEGILPVRVFDDHLVVDPPHFSWIEISMDHDSDGDGVSNYGETARLNTDYNSTDSDGDGVADAQDVDPLHNVGIAFDVWDLESAIPSSSATYAHISIPALQKGGTAEYQGSMIRFKSDIPDGFTTYRSGADTATRTVTLHADGFSADISKYYLDVYFGYCSRDLLGEGHSGEPSTTATNLTGAASDLTYTWQRSGATTVLLNEELLRPTNCSQLDPSIISGSISYVVIRWEVLTGDYEVISTNQASLSFCVGCGLGSHDAVGREMISGTSTLGWKNGCCLTYLGNGTQSDGITTLEKRVSLWNDEFGRAPASACDGLECLIDQDPDDDGLTTLTERGSILSGGLGTDPVDADSDHDGWPDGLESNLKEPESAFTDRFTNFDCVKTGGSILDSTRRAFKSATGSSYLNTNAFKPYGSTSVGNPASDTDADGVPDGVEDFDFDALLDSNEANPLKFDTDGDKLADGRELRIWGPSSSTPPRFCDLVGVGEHNKGYDSNNANELKAFSSDTDGDGVADGGDVLRNSLQPSFSIDPQKFGFYCDFDGGDDAIELYFKYRIIVRGFLDAEVRVPGSGYITVAYPGNIVPPPDDTDTYKLISGSFKAIAGNNLPSDIADWQASLDSSGSTVPGYIELQARAYDVDVEVHDQIDLEDSDGYLKRWKYSYSVNAAGDATKDGFSKNDKLLLGHSDPNTPDGHGDGDPCKDPFQVDDNDAHVTLEMIDTIPKHFFNQAQLVLDGNGAAIGPPAGSQRLGNT